MAGYIIHLAIAQEYLRKNKNIENYDEFIKGVIAPDRVKDKSLTHYGEKSSRVKLKDFLENNKIDNSYKKGEFLHLVTDYLFYNKYIYFGEGIYNDYDIINKALIEKYNIKIPKEVRDKIFFVDGKAKMLTLELAIKIIDDISSINLEKVVNQILSDDIYWNTYLDV